MRSVADDLRKELDQRVRDLALERRIELAFELGERDLALLQAAQGVDRATALRIIRQQRQAGRRRSKCMRELEGLER